MSFGLTQQFLWRRCQGLVNSPLAMVLYISTCVLVRINKFYGAVAGDRKNLLNQYSDERRKY